MSNQENVKIAPANGKLGVLIPGIGAVSTTFIAGVEAVKRGLGQPVGSLTQLATIRLGKRTEARTPYIRDFVPLAKLDDLVFGGWDIYEDTAWESANNAKVLEQSLLDKVREPLEAIKPMKAVFDREYIKRINGPNVKTEGTKYDKALALMEDIRNFQETNQVSRTVMIWCGSTEVFHRPSEVHETLASFEEGMKNNHPEIAPSQIYAYAALMSGVPFANGAPNLTHDIPALLDLAREAQPAGLRQGLQDRSDLHEDAAGAWFQGSHVGHEWLVFHQYSGQPRWRSTGRSWQFQIKRRDQTERAAADSAA